jgi:benzoate transport
MSRDPNAGGGTAAGSALADAPMSRVQVVAVAMCCLLTALDGYDVMSISFAAPGIADDWNIERSALGLVLSAELIGMGIGSLLIGSLADRYGRRNNVLACLVIMTAGMFLAGMARDVTELLVYRLFTGVAIGGMLACTSALAAEYSNRRFRSFSVILMAGGYPLGVVLGGTGASWLLASYDWRSVFFLGAAMTALFLPLAWYLLPESVEHLLSTGNADKRARAHSILARMGRQPATSASPALGEGRPGGGLRALFAPGMRRATLLLVAAYTLHIMTFYFFVKWTPKIVADMGFAASLAGSILVWANVGGLLGCLLIGLMTLSYPVRSLVIVNLVAGSVTVALFGLGPETLLGLSVAAAAAGFFTNAAVVGIYALSAHTFPTELRAGGTGLVIGFGRGGSVAGPVLAGVLLQAGFGLPWVALVLAGGSMAAVLAVAALKPASAPA